MANRKSNSKYGKIDSRSCEYPSRLKEIKDPPKILYFRGEWDPEIFKECLSVVGSRRITAYGEIITEQLVRETAASGITIVSGFMYGVDASAHKAALESGGRTIAVMPCGIDIIYPEYQETLYNEILYNKSLVISEYSGKYPAALWTFPRRNRIIAALSPALLVVEAGIKSGALITAEISFKYNKKILAVPGPLTSTVSIGTANLIKRGATIVTGSEDILNLYGKFSLEKGSGERSPSYKVYPSGDIINLLSEEALPVDEIARRSGKGISETGAEITKLMLNKLITQRGGLFYLSSGGRNAY